MDNQDEDCSSISQMQQEYAKFLKDNIMRRIVNLTHELREIKKIVTTDPSKENIANL